MSNQSFANDPVDIKIHIDDALAVSQDFYVKGQHNRKQFQFQLTEGTHTMSAESEKGEAKLETDFELEDVRWCVVDYWYYPENSGGAGPTPRQFTVHILDSQPFFD